MRCKEPKYSLFLYFPKRVLSLFGNVGYKVGEQVLRDWPGKLSIGTSVLVEPFVSLTSWNVLRCGESGHHLIEVRFDGGIPAISTCCAWCPKPFKVFFRERFINIECLIGRFEIGFKALFEV